MTEKTLYGGFHGIVGQSLSHSLCENRKSQNGAGYLLERRGFQNLCRERIQSMSKTTKQGTVQKIIQSPHPKHPETAEISVQGADELYKEIRIENILEDEKGNEVKLKEGASVDVVVEADSKATIPNTLQEKR